MNENSNSPSPEELREVRRSEFNELQRRLLAVVAVFEREAFPLVQKLREAPGAVEAISITDGVPDGPPLAVLARMLTRLQAMRDENKRVSEAMRKAFAWTNLRVRA